MIVTPRPVSNIHTSPKQESEYNVQSIMIDIKTPYSCTKSPKRPYEMPSRAGYAQVRDWGMHSWVSFQQTDPPNIHGFITAKSPTPTLQALMTQTAVE